MLVEYLGAAAALAACSVQGFEGGPDTIRGPAILAHYSDSAMVRMPGSAHVGVPVSITVTSFGGGCITQGDTEVTVRGLVAEVRPYRYETVRLPPNAACTSELRIFEHTVSFQFSEPGEASVRIVGLRRPQDAPYILERELTVLP